MLSHTNNTESEPWWHFGIEIVFAVFVAVAGAVLASHAAFPSTPEKSMADEASGFWQEKTHKQQKERSSQTLAKQPTSESELATTSRPAKPDSQKDSNPTDPPTVNARSYLVANLQTGEILAEKNSRKRVPIASLSKLMTAVVADETIDDKVKIEVSEEADNTYGNTGGLAAGMNLLAKTLYYPLLLSSSNDAAAVLAEHSSKAKFLGAMNRKALALGMNNTHFKDVSGLSDQNESTARDLLTLLQYIYKHKQPLLDITTKASHTTQLPDQGVALSFANNHPLHGKSGYLGGKNGYTDTANHTLISTFSVDQYDSPIAIIILGSNSHVADTNSLLDWVKDS